MIGGIVGAGVGLPAILIAAAAAGAGHGTYVPAAFLFPSSMLIATLAGNINSLAAALAIVQYPLYGITVAGSNNSRVRWLALVFLHSLLTVLSFLSVQRSEVFG